jgi:hypothetical protein
MAKQTTLLTFTGRLGNLIGYCRNGKYFLRSMPETVRQTTATRRAARRFGAASRKAALIRSAVNPELDVHCDRTHINRLNKVLITGNNIVESLAGFRFNQHTGIDRFFPVAPVMSGNNTLHIPSQPLSFPKDITVLEVKVIATRISFAQHNVVSTDVAMVTLHPRETFAGANIPLDVPGKGILIVTLQVMAIHNGQPSGNKKNMAADIVAVSASQTKGVSQKPTYSHPARTQLQNTAINCISASLSPSLIQRE